MKWLTVIAFVSLAPFSARLGAAPGDIVPELLDYNLKSTVSAYDKAGSKNPKWNAAAKRCLELFARMRSITKVIVNT